jgi:hypothetical protein
MRAESVKVVAQHREFPPTATQAFVRPTTRPCSGPAPKGKPALVGMKPHGHSIVSPHRMAGEAMVAVEDHPTLAIVKQL